MQITKQADYAVRAVLHLAKMEPDDRASTAGIAKQERIPSSFLAKIISQLSIAGIIQTTRGAKGGVVLAKKPEDITLLDVVESIDGPIALNECVLHENVCAFDQECPIKQVWCDAQAELVAKLRATNFASFL